MARRTRHTRTDLTTPRERAWLDRLVRVRGDMAGIFIDHRTGPADGQFTGLTVPLRRHSRQYGFYPVDYAWVKREVRNGERELRRRAAQEVRNHIGAYI